MGDDEFESLGSVMPEIDVESLELTKEQFRSEDEVIGAIQSGAGEITSGLGEFPNRATGPSLMSESLREEDEGEELLQVMMRNRTMVSQSLDDVYQLPSSQMYATPLAAMSQDPLVGSELDGAQELLQKMMEDQQQAQEQQDQDGEAIVALAETQGDDMGNELLEQMQRQKQTFGGWGGDEDEDGQGDDIMEDLDDYLLMQQQQQQEEEELPEDMLPDQDDDMHGGQMDSSTVRTATKASDEVPCQGAQATAAASKRPAPISALADAAKRRKAAAFKSATTDALLQHLFSDDEDDDADRAQRDAAAAAAEEAKRRALQRLPRLQATDVPGECIPVTSSATGARVYCAKEASGRAEAGAGGSSGLPPGEVRPGKAADKKGLLPKPMAEMMRELDDERIAQAIALSERAAEALREAAEGAEDDLVSGFQGHHTTPGKRKQRQTGGRKSHSPMAAIDGEEADHHSEVGGSSLWVNKYAPRTFTSLLSDEATNREVAKWIKAWDKPGGPAAAAATAASAVSGAGRGGSGAFGGRSGAAGAGRGVFAQGGRGGRGGRGGYGSSSGHWGSERVLLIAGPPGLGKTTLAHVVASHCGYNPYEINASDDRTAGNLTQRINDAVQMKAVLGGGRPNCVIIDEIDGATGGAEGVSAISALLRIVNAGTGDGGKRHGGGGKGMDSDDGQMAGAQDSPGSGAAKVGGGGGKRGGGRGLPPLKRPIICICNDLYAPALRPLREVARVFHFKAPTRDRLLSRLISICEKEGVKADKQALGALCDRTECDIRSCLNTLQFLARQHGNRITLRTVEGSSIGTKDTTRGAFALWNDLLQSRSRKAASPASSRVDELWSSVNAFGETELVLNGLFENLHTVRFLDINFKKTSKMADRLAEADSMLKFVRHHNEFAFMQYTVPPLLYCHVTAAQPERPNVTWPKAQGEVARRQVAAAELCRGWSSSLVPAVAQVHGRGSLMMELLPALKIIMAPPLRAVAAHLMPPEEQQLMAHTVEVMMDYALQYDLQAAAALEAAGVGLRPGDVVMRPLPLKPAVDLLHVFGAPKASSDPSNPATSASRPVPPPVTTSAATRALPLVVRQMLTQHATQEAIRRAEVSRVGPSDVAQTRLGGDQAPPLNHQMSASATATGGLSGPRPPQRPPTKPLPAVPAAALKAPKQNWLDAMRNNAGRKSSSNRPLEPAGVPQQGTGAGASAMTEVGAATECKSRTSQFKVLYKFNEGYTNAVKRPLLMGELL